MVNKVVKIIKGIAIGCLMFGMFLILAYEQTHYVRVGHVKQIAQHGVLFEYSFIDGTGNEWLFNDKNILDTDTLVKVVMFNNCTEENIYDDMVIKYKIISEK